VALRHAGIARRSITGDVILSPRNRKFEEWLKLRDKLLPLIPQEDLDALDNLRDSAPPVERDWP
jgi:hypothetical protein